MVSSFFHPLKWHRFFNCHVFVDARLLLHFGWQLANSAHRLPAPQVVIRQLEVSIASGMSVCCSLHSTNCAAFGEGVDNAGAQAWADYEVFWSKVPWFNGPAVPRSRVHGPGPAMAEQQLDLNAAAEALSEAVVGAVAAVDAQAPAEPPAQFLPQEFKKLFHKAAPRLPIKCSDKASKSRLLSLAWLLTGLWSTMGAWAEKQSLVASIF